VHTIKADTNRYDTHSIGCNIILIWYSSVFRFSEFAVHISKFWNHKNCKLTVNPVFYLKTANPTMEPVTALVILVICYKRLMWTRCVSLLNYTSGFGNWCLVIVFGHVKCLLHNSPTWTRGLVNLQQIFIITKWLQ